MLCLPVARTIRGLRPRTHAPRDALLTAFRGVAQLVEHRSPKPRAVGSSPSAPASAAVTWQK
jgi:hypothetical protein